MGALTAVTPTRTGVAVTGNNVASSDTIAAALLGTKGANLEILNGSASADNMTISDAGSSPAGTPATSYPGTVAAGQNKVFYIAPSQADPTTGLVTVTHSQTTTVTYKLTSLG